MFEVFLGGAYLLSLSDLPGDLILVRKIITLMAIIAWVLQHLGKGPLSIIIIAVVSWFVICDYFAFFGGIYVLYMLMLFGFTGVIIDFFFVAPQGGGQQQGEGPISNGKDYASRQASAIQRLRAGR